MGAAHSLGLEKIRRDSVAKSGFSKFVGLATGRAKREHRARIKEHYSRLDEEAVEYTP